MKEYVLKPSMNRLCLTFFILLCSIFICRNVFSMRDWQKNNLLLIYNQKDKTITFCFLFYDYWGDNNKNYGWLLNCDFFYSEDGNKYIYLMNVNTKEQEEAKISWLKMSIKKPGEQIQLLNSYTPANYTMLPDDGRELLVSVKPTYFPYRTEVVWVETKRSYMKVKWKIPQSCKSIKSVQLMGSWLSDGKNNNKINEVYTMIKVNSNSINIKNDSLQLNSEISKNIQLTGKSDAINVTGAEPGENIKVYAVSGVELKSVVANDDVVNIKLPKNQIYIVKVGQTSQKIAL